MGEKLVLATDGKLVMCDPAAGSIGKLSSTNPDPVNIECFCVSDLDACHILMPTCLEFCTVPSITMTGNLFKGFGCDFTFTVNFTIDIQLQPLDVHGGAAGYAGSWGGFNQFQGIVGNFTFERFDGPGIQCVADTTGGNIYSNLSAALADGCGPEVSNLTDATCWIGQARVFCIPPFPGHPNHRFWFQLVLDPRTTSPTFFCPTFEFNFPFDVLTCPNNSMVFVGYLGNSFCGGSFIGYDQQNVSLDFHN